MCAFLDRLFRGFVKDESGATSLEYALIAAGISVAIIAAVNGVGTALSAKYGAIKTGVQ